MPYNIRIVSTYPPRTCGIGTFSRDLANALEHFTGEVGNVRIAAIDNGNRPYHIPVDLIIDQYNAESWRYAIRDIIARANESPNLLSLASEVWWHESGGGHHFRIMQRAVPAERLAR